MKKYALSLLGFCLLSGGANAAVLISLTSGVNSPVFQTTSGVLPDGSYVRIGTFETQPTAGSSFEALKASFREFGLTTSGHSADAGKNKGLINRLSVPGDAGGDPDGFFTGKSVYIWVYNSATASDSAEQGVFKSTTGIFVDDPVGSSTSVSVSGFHTAFGQFEGGTAAGTTLAANGNVASFQLAAPIPEPSVTGLLAILGLATLRRKR